MELLGVQLDIAWEDREANHAKVRALLQSSRPKAGAVVALPEMFASGFSMNLDRIADNETRASERFLIEIAKQHSVCVVGGLATKRPDCRGHNEAVAVTPDGRVIARYAKIHPYTPGKEAQHYAGGDAIVTFDAGGGFTIAPFVCYDLRFPEIFRAGMQRGANVMVVIASWPSPRVEHWLTLLRARAIENQCYVMGVNRCGNDPYLPYPGRSIIVDFRGNVIADAGEREGVVRADADLSALTNHRKELPFLADAKTNLSSLFK
jgi:predicted amidohydrolase